MGKLDFKKVNQLVKALETLDASFGYLMTDQSRQEKAIQEAGRKVLAKSAKESLSRISIEELKNSKAGIRVSALQEAGYATLADLDQAADWELQSVEGIGEKQMESIRNILVEFGNHMAEHLSVRMSVEEKSVENDALICALAAYRKGEQVRADAEGLQQELHEFVAQAISRLIIRSRIRWVFSGKKAKETTAMALEDILDFYHSPFGERVTRLVALYEDAIQTGIGEAMADFRRNSADYYALLERCTGSKLASPLVYSSIPAQLAAEIDALEPDLTALKGNLRGYQTFGVKYILHQKNVLLGDEMGLGKTIQAIGAMTAINQETPDAHFLVVCPASVLINWCREIRKFSSLRVCLLHGAGLDGSFLKWQQEGGAAVTNYETMGKLIDRINDHMKIDMLVIDEAHYIKNPDAKRTRYIRTLDNESDRILMMTGTPLENRVEEMCALLDFVRPDLADQARKAAYMSQIPQFREMLSPVYLRRQREQVLEELPPIEEKRQWCAMTETDRELYVQNLAEGNFATMRRVGFLQEDLRQSSKALRLEELCKEAMDEGRKVLVYSFFRETVRKVSEFLGELCIGTITGNTPIADRQAWIDRFAEAPEGSVLVCQIQAGGTGLNIQSASIVIFCEPQIKPSLTNQAISRVYRMGQVRNVLVHHLLCEDTVDEAMIHLLESKQAEFDSYADESTMAEATENLIDREWIQRFLEEENRKYLPMVIE